MSSRSLLVALVSISFLAGCGGEELGLDGTLESDLRGGIKGGPKRGATDPALDAGTAEPAPAPLPPATEPAPDAGTAEPAPAPPPPATEPAPDGRRAVSAAEPSSASTATVRLSGTYAEGDTFWLFTPDQGGFGSGCLSKRDEIRYEGLKPGGTYRTYVAHADGTHQAAVLFTMPPLVTETQAPRATGLQSGIVYFGSGAGIGLYAGDDSGISRVDFFANGSFIGSHLVSQPRIVVAPLFADPSLSFRYLEPPASLRGTSALIRAVVYDLLGNTTELSATFLVN